MPPSLATPPAAPPAPASPGPRPDATAHDGSSHDAASHVAPAPAASSHGAWDPMQAFAAARPGAPADRLRARLDDPRTAAALETLLDHAELLAQLVTMLDGTLRRGDAIVEAVGDGVREARAALGGNLPDPDTLAALRRLGTIGKRMLEHHTLEALTALTDASQPVLESGLLDPKLVRQVAHAGAALAGSYEATRAAQPQPLGVRGLFAALRDPDVRRGLGFAVGLARSYGRTLAMPPAQPSSMAASRPATLPAASDSPARP